MNLEGLADSMRICSTQEGTREDKEVTMARKFFFICAGLLCLAVALKLGATVAVAQTATLDVAEAELGLYAGTIGRTVYLATQTDPGGPLDFYRSFSVPGSSRILAVHVGGNSTYPVTAVLENGDVYVATNFGSSWNLAGNIIGGGPTPARVTTWGSLKSRYR
jgi:hypothetical protein